MRVIGMMIQRFSGGGGDMRMIIWGLCGFMVVGVCTVGVFGQRTTGGPGTVIRRQAPTDKAVDFSQSDLNVEFQEMATKKVATVRLLEGGAYNVNIRRLEGAETALVHGKKTDVWVVREGEGTLVTGGELVDPRKGAEEGDASGSSIRGGQSRPIKVGDVVFIPAGVPHGVREVKGHIVFLNIRFDTK
jgi:mannose-6-phosphate isomerase-like protein (cupin superfamily)